MTHVSDSSKPLEKPLPAGKTRPSAPVPAGQAQTALPALHVGRELADTTWRIVVPVVLFAGAGIVIDRHTGGKPWLALAGMVLGLILGGLLVKQQIGRWPVAPLSGSKTSKAAGSPGAKPSDRMSGRSYDDDEEDYYTDGGDNR